MQNSIRSVPPFSFLRIQSQAPLRTNHKHQPQSQYRTTFSLRQNAQAPTNTVHSTRLFCRNFPRSDHVLKKLHLDDLRDSQAPAVSEAPSQYLGPLRLPASFTLNAFAQICAKVRKWGFSVRLARARAKQCALSSTTAPPSRRANPLRHNARALRSNRQNLHELHAQKMS